MGCRMRQAFGPDPAVSNFLNAILTAASTGPHVAAEFFLAVQNPRAKGPAESGGPVWGFRQFEKNGATRANWNRYRRSSEPGTGRTYLPAEPKIRLSDFLNASSAKPCAEKPGLACRWRGGLGDCLAPVRRCASRQAECQPRIGKVVLRLPPRRGRRKEALSISRSIRRRDTLRLAQRYAPIKCTGDGEDVSDGGARNHVRQIFLTQSR
jgi:hypothetical protein